MSIYKVPDLNEQEIRSIQAVWNGEATEGQQRQAMNVIIHKLCMTDAMSYQQGDLDGTAFMSGREFVGKQIRTLTRWRPQ